MSLINSVILVTGGASFIGSHLVDRLVEKGTRVRVVDDLSSGKIENINGHIKSKRIEFIKGDLLDPWVAARAVKGVDYVFHLAAIHGGRGFVDTYQAAVAANMQMDIQLIRICHKENIKNFIFASSGCVYPNYLQTDIRKKIYLSEKKVGPPFDPDNMYGWAKLTTEKVLGAFYHDYGFPSVSCRFFTVYGERGHENHAVMAIIARAFIRQDPFEVWGNGLQVRNWTYVGDIVGGMIAAAEKIRDGSAVNLGTTERIRVKDAVHNLLGYVNFHPKVVFRPEMPTGPKNRVCDNLLADKRLGWQPKVKFFDGLHRTADWYFSVKNQAMVRKNLKRLLIERS